MAFKDIVTLFVVIAIASIYIFMSMDLEWEKINAKMIGETRSDNLPLISMAIIRLFFASIIWTSLAMIYFDSGGLDVTYVLKDGTKKYFNMKKFERFTMFTVWSWILQGVYFSLASFFSFLVYYEQNYGKISNFDIFSENIYVSKGLMAITWVLFEVSFPVSFIVSGVVTFVLIPFSKRNKIAVDAFYKPIPLLMHNANVIFMAFEIVFNKLMFNIWHFPFILFYGKAYAIFSWIWYKYRGLYYYFFLDYERHDSLFWYSGLMVGAGLLYLIGYSLSLALNQYESILPTLIIGGLTVLVAKLYDT